MLVLSRNQDERLLIGDNIEIVIVSSSRGKVRIGIQAPKDIRILRKELIDDQSEKPNH